MSQFKAVKFEIKIPVRYAPGGGTVVTSLVRSWAVKLAEDHCGKIKEPFNEYIISNYEHMGRDEDEEFFVCFVTVKFFSVKTGIEEVKYV